jgi:flagellar biosynthesis/type III secretory pathway protein FliH
MSSLSIGRGFAGLIASNPGSATIELTSQRTRSAEVEAIRQELDEKYSSRLNEQEARISGLLGSVDESIAAFMEDFEKKVVGQMIEVSLRIAEMIIRTRLPDREMVEEVIKSTLAPIMDLQGVRVKLCASDAAMINESSKEDISRALKQVEIVVDAKLKEGDVFVESANGYFNAKVDERLKLLEVQLKERCGNVST